MPSVQAKRIKQILQLLDVNNTYSTLFVHDKIVDFIASLSKDAWTITCPKKREMNLI